jgi:transposase
MIATVKPRRQRSHRVPFLRPPWDDDHPDFRRLDQQLPADHHARWLRQAVARLDLTPLRRAYANRGSLAHPPEQLLPFVLFMYAKKLASPAEWFRQARHNDEAKWLLRGLRPGRSALYAFRDRTEPFLDRWHKQLLDWAVAQGITSGRRGSLDGTFVAALASRHRLLRAPTLDGRLALLTLAVELDGYSPDLVGPLLGALASLAPALPDQGPSGLSVVLVLLRLRQLRRAPAAAAWALLPRWLPRSAAGRRRLWRRYQQAQQRLQQRLQPYQTKKRLSRKDRQALQRAKIAPTDPEAALGWDKGGTYRPLYNLQLVKATDAPLILSWELFGRNNDEGLLRPMLQQTQRQQGRPLAEVLVDGAYVSISDLLYCEDQGITVYAPPEPTASAGAGPPKGPKKYAKERFDYDAQKRTYHCPAGKELPEVYRTSESRQGGVSLPVLVHRASASDCQQCGERSRCTTGKNGRVVKRYQGEEVLQRLKQRMQEPASQQVYRQRCQTVELGYADLKEHRGLRVFRCFGSQRSRAQAGLTILASNALSIVRALQKRAREVSPPSCSEKQPA